jgi:glucoamylase
VRGPIEFWKFNRQVGSMPAGGTLRVQSGAPFRLHWTLDEWQQTQDTMCSASGIGTTFADIAVPKGQRAPVRFTFFWTEEGRWEGKDYQVTVE